MIINPVMKSFISNYQLNDGRLLQDRQDLRDHHRFLLYRMRALPMILRLLIRL